MVACLEKRTVKLHEEGARLSFTLAGRYDQDTAAACTRFAPAATLVELETCRGRVRRYKLVDHQQRTFFSLRSGAAQLHKGTPGQESAHQPVLSWAHTRHTHTHPHTPNHTRACVCVMCVLALPLFSGAPQLRNDSPGQ